MKVLQGFDNVISGPKDMRYITEKKARVFYPIRRCVNYIIAWPCTLVLPKNFLVINQYHLKESINGMFV
jgi:hypothetical protein